MNRGSMRSCNGASAMASRFNEAPIHESGKWQGEDHGARVPVRASMRPRFMNRGSAITILTSASGADGFNEAQIHESGKSWSGSAVHGEALRFNEAPIHESGKWMR